MGWRERTQRANLARPFHLLAAIGISTSLVLIVTLQATALGWQDGEQIFRLAWIYGGAGAGGTILGSWLATWLGLRGPRAFAAWAVLVGGFVMALGAFVFALTYRAAYSQWHADAFTIGWTFQTVFTMAGAAYFWAVLGTRMILPWALMPLVVGALAFARRRG